MAQQKVDLIKIEKQLYYSSFKSFIKKFWPLVSNYGLVWNWHLDALIEHLEAVAKGKITNLLINICPRSGKSIITSILFPVWLWVRNSKEQIITASYGKSLSTEFSRLSRKLIESEEFKKYFVINLLEDTNRKDAYSNTDGGKRMAVSPGSATTGIDGSVLIIDDLNSIAERESEVERDAVIDYYRNSLCSRAVTVAKTKIVIIQQRVHAADLSGHIIENHKHDFTFLVIPFEYRPIDLPNQLGWKDPRTETNEVFWKEFFPPEKVDNMKIGYRNQWSCLFNQDVNPSDGVLFKSKDIKTYKETENNYILGDRTIAKKSCWRFAVTDLAIGLKKENDYTACGVYDCIGGNMILVHILRDRIDGARIIPTLKAIYQTYKPDFIGIEDVAFQRLVIDQLRQTNIPVKALAPKGADKETRSIQAQIKVEAWQLWVPPGKPWVTDFISELTAFPNGRWDDNVDQFAYACVIASKYDSSKMPMTDEEAEELYKKQEQDHFNNLMWAGVE